MKNWTGSKNSIFKTLGASNHTKKTRQTQDYYATEPKAIDVLMSMEKFRPNIWECACGEGHMAEAIKKYGYNVLSTDLIDRGYGQGGVDFLQQKEVFDGDIITNPPYKFAQQFIEKAFELLPQNHKLALFLKIQFLEGKNRKNLFLKNPPKFVLVSSSRLLCAKNGDFQTMIDNGGSAIAYGWFIWINGYKGDTLLQWVN